MVHSAYSKPLLVIVLLFTVWLSLFAVDLSLPFCLFASLPFCLFASLPLSPFCHNSLGRIFSFSLWNRSYSCCASLLPLRCLSASRFFRLVLARLLGVFALSLSHYFPLLHFVPLLFSSPTLFPPSFLVCCFLFSFSFGLLLVLVSIFRRCTPLSCLNLKFAFAWTTQKRVQPTLLTIDPRSSRVFPFSRHGGCVCPSVPGDAPARC